MNPARFWIYKIFEPGLARDNSTNTPCLDRGYDDYKGTPTHGVYPITMTLDLYGPHKEEEVLPAWEAEAIAISKGFLEGALEAEGFDDIEHCIKDAESVITDAEAAIKDFEQKSAKGVLAGLKEVAQMMTA